MGSISMMAFLLKIMTKLKARLIYQNGVSQIVEGVCIHEAVYVGEPIWKFIFGPFGPDQSVVTGVECEGVYKKSVPPIRIEYKLLEVEIKGIETAFVVGDEIDLVERTPAKELPLIMNDLKTWTGMKTFEEKLNGIIK
jgi:hypothetical protein